MGRSRLHLLLSLGRKQRVIDDLESQGPCRSSNCDMLDICVHDVNVWVQAYVGKIMVWRMSLHLGSLGMATVSLPEQGAPPTKVLSEADVQQRWQILDSFTLLLSVLVADPASIRNPCLCVSHVLCEESGHTYLLEGSCLAARDIVDIQTTIIDKLALGSTITDLRDTAGRLLVGSLEA